MIGIFQSIMLEYKLKLYGIQLIKQEESYTSQCSPLSSEVSKRYAEASNRKERGKYITNGVRYNADGVGAFNILRKYLSVSGKEKTRSVNGLKNPEIIKVAESRRKVNGKKQVPFCPL